MSHPIIGITTNLLYRPSATDGKFITANNQEYDQAILATGGIPLLLPNTLSTDCITSQLALCDGILLAGGDDINPLVYGEEPSSGLGETNTLVDTYQLKLTALALASGKPILGICRGMQVLNIACGGNVYQDLSDNPKVLYKHMQAAPREQCCHTVTTSPNSILAQLFGDSFEVNSFHHQAVHKIGKTLTPIAWALDGTVEAICNPLTPFTLGVQWHPEIMLHASQQMRPLFEAFIAACLKQ